MKYTAQSLDDLPRIARQITAEIAATPIVAFRAPMGAGKTTLIKSLCSAMGVTDVVNSPTFAIVNEYADADDRPVYHFDFYRLKSVAEAYDMGCEDYFYSGSFCFIEWPEMIEELLPEHRAEISIEADDCGTRTISVSLL